MKKVLTIQRNAGKVVAMKRKRRITLIVSEELHAALMHYARQQGRSMQQQLTRMLQHALIFETENPGRINEKEKEYDI